MKKLVNISSVVGSLVMLSAPLVAFADSLGQPEPGIAGGSAWTLDKVKSVINTIGQTMIILGVVIAVIFIIWGGINYMLAQGDPKKADTAKTQIKNGLIGAAIVLGVGVILQTISSLVTGQFFGAGS